MDNSLVVAGVFVTLELHLVNCFSRIQRDKRGVSRRSSCRHWGQCSRRKGWSLTTATLGASVVLELVVHVKVDDIVRVGGVTGASDDTGRPL